MLIFVVLIVLAAVFGTKLALWLASKEENVF
jgi:hypothetical protein